MAADTEAPVPAPSPSPPSGSVSSSRLNSPEEDEIQAALRKKRVSEASARMRANKKLALQKLALALEAEQTKIERFKNDMKRLQVENELLKQMVLGPRKSEDLNDNWVAGIGRMSNYELLRKLNRE